jgi:hypothetical protein
MSKLVIMGAVEVTPGTRDHILPILTAHRDRCLRDEPGTLQFEVVLLARTIQKRSFTKSTMMTQPSRRIGMHRPGRNG